jgi:hypothetical protein
VNAEIQQEQTEKQTFHTKFREFVVSTRLRFHLSAGEAHALGAAALVGVLTPHV